MPISQEAPIYSNGQSSSGPDQFNHHSDSNRTESPPPKLQKTASWMAKDKLSKEFRSINDEDELGKLMGDAGEQLLAFVDDIRKIESLRDIELGIPQLVVVGDTSTGKSSVLQALTRLPFPVAGELCTRFVTETTIRRCRPSEKPGYRIEVRMDKSTHNGEPPFIPKIFDSNEWIDVYQRLKEDIADAFDSMSPDKLSSTVHRTTASSISRVGSQFEGVPLIPQLLRHRLHISVRKPDQAHFSIVDIPGLVSNGAIEDINLSEELIAEYIRNKEAIVLAVVPATTVLENQKVFNLVHENHASDRTIGVITKCDTIQPKDEEKTFSILRNRPDSRNHLKLGWFAVRNRSSKETFDESSFEERDKKEAELFENGKWKEAVLSSSYLTSIDPNILGIKNLKRTLQRSLYKRVKENFPVLKTKMGELQEKYHKQLQELGDPRDNPREQRVYLSDIQSRYEVEVERSLNGNYRSGLSPGHASRLRYHIKEFNKVFEPEIRVKGLKYSWHPDDENASENENTTEGDTFGGIFQWIYQTWIYHTGSEPRGDIPSGLKKVLFKEQTYSWEARTMAYMEKVEKAIEDCRADLFETVCNDDTLRGKIQEKLDPFKIEAFAAARKELQHIIEDLDYLDTWHPEFEKYERDLQEPRVNRQVRQSNQSDLDKSSSNPGKQQSLENFDFIAYNNRVFAVHDWLWAYWRICLPRFVDNVIIQVVERHLLSPKGPLKLFNRHWINRLSDEELEDLVGEDEAIMNERKMIKEKLEGLADALKRAADITSR